MTSQVSFVPISASVAPQQPFEVGSARVKPGTMRALAISYFNSTGGIPNSDCVGFRSLNLNTQSVYRNIIERFCEETDKEGNKLGDKSAASLRRDHIVKLMTARMEKPEAANGFRKVLRAMMSHAVAIGLRADDPTRDVNAIRVRSDGFHSWTDAEIEQFERRHPTGTRARLALALARRRYAARIPR